MPWWARKRHTIVGEDYGVTAAVDFSKSRRQQLVRPVLEGQNLQMDTPVAATNWISKLSRIPWQEAILVIASCAFCYLMLEIGYRAYQYATLPRRLFEILAALQSDGPATNDQYIFDANVGFRYAPNFTGERGSPWFSHWRTNQWGHVSRSDYPQHKPVGEFRIGIVGDSFTAAITNNVRWSDLLEDRLNESAAWRASVGNRSTRVINFAVDGHGFVQFAAMLHYVQAFEPDLVMITFITDDIFRKLRFLNVPYSTGNRTQDLRAYIEKNYLEDINWLRPYPELLAATLGPYLGTKTMLPLDPMLVLATNPRGRYGRSEGIAATTTAVRAIVSFSPRSLFVQAPQFQELEGYPLKESAKLPAVVQAPNLRFVSMIPAMWARMSDKSVLTRWYFTPDQHPTDAWAEVFADEVSKWMIANAPL
jgi:hypothetical protein